MTPSNTFSLTDYDIYYQDGTDNLVIKIDGGDMNIMGLDFYTDIKKQILSALKLQELVKKKLDFYNLHWLNNIQILLTMKDYEKLLEESEK